MRNHKLVGVVAALSILSVFTFLISGNIGILPGTVQAQTPTSVNVSQSAEYGDILVDASGMTLYLFTNDERNKSNCSGGCATAWPPLLTAGDPTAGEGVTADRLGTITRDDGSIQVTYNGWPLYYVARDEKPGDTNGQYGTWFVVSTFGGPIASNAAVNTVEDATYGTILVEASGRTLYLFTNDERNKSNCSGGCGTAWPPLLTAGGPTAGEGVTADRLGTITRDDGYTQVTYNGWPLYYVARDEKPGDTSGQNVGDVWFVIDLAGQAVRPAVVEPPSVGDSTLPSVVLAGLSLVGVLLLGSGGVLLRRRLNN
jgi:predicted lipoprotein with Yx(FWY)xxD motif